MIRNINEFNTYFQMKKKFVATSGLILFAAALAAKEPVIMTVNGVDVPRSEFEYLYGKNSKQQLNPQSLDEYVEMFKLYKLKVADAKAEGIDTLESFKKEMREYRRELAAPYLTDSAFLNKLLKETYDRSGQEAEAIHIMMFKTPDAKENRLLYNRLDSIRREIIGGADFAELARQYSQDKGSAQNGGRMDYLTAGRIPYYSFESAVFNTPEGKISEIVESPVGYHLIKGGKRRAARGKVLVAHILRLARGNDEEADKKAKTTIDSIYNLVSADPDSFAELAKKYSEDGSARQGGNLPWFGPGEMVVEFDSVAFALPVNSISQPFRTAFGWHIIKKLDKKGIPSMAEMKPAFIARVTSPQDERFELIRANQTEKLSKLHKAKVNDKTLKSIYESIDKNGLDSLFYSDFTSGRNGNSELFIIDGTSYPVENLVSQMKGIIQPEPVAARKIFDSNFDSFYNGRLVEAEEERLYKVEPAYRNLLNEYNDGSLLYEVSVKKVWDPAAKDVEALENYFNSHKDNYKWSVPHAKGYLVKSLNDTIGNQIRQLASETGRDSLVNTIRKAFPGKCSIEKILVEKGTNPVVDHLLFGGEAPKTSKSKFNDVFMIDPRILNDPEELNDVKGLVTSDYQNELQSQWEEELKRLYPVKINDKVLKTVKQHVK